MCLTGYYLHAIIRTSSLQMLCAAILDGMFVATLGKSCAIGWPSPIDDVETSSSSSSWIYCTTHSSMQPFSDGGAESDATNDYYPTSLLSMGWLLAASASVAMGMVDLSEMMNVQYFLFGCLVVSAIRFSVVLRRMMPSADEDVVVGDDVNDNDSTTHNYDVRGSVADGVKWFVGPNPFQAVGPIMFNFAFVVTSPPSAARAISEESAYKSLGLSCLLMGILYMMVGLSGAHVSNAVTNGSIPGNNSNLLSLILLSGDEAGSGPSMFDLCMIGKHHTCCSMIALMPTNLPINQTLCIPFLGIAHFLCVGLFGLSTVASVPGEDLY